MAFNPINATNKAITWSSSNSSVAKVTEGGTGIADVTALSVGSSTITATAVDNSKTYTSSCVVTVSPAVNIAVSNGNIAEGSTTPAIITISSSAVTSNIVVGYTISGTASATDYTATPALSGSVTLTPTTPSSSISIKSNDDTSFEGSETIIVTINSGTGYNLGGNTIANISIADNENPPCTGSNITKTSTPITIDAVVDAAWSNAPEVTISNATMGSKPADFAGKYRALWDNNNLYFLVEVSDATKTNDSGSSWWEDDVIEIFLDGDNSKGDSYDGQNDFQLGFRWNDANINIGGGSKTNITGIVKNIYATASGYSLEVSIPWTTIGVTPTIGNKIGLDVEVDDDDNGGTRDTQMSAYATTSDAWSKPSVFGTGFITSCDVAIVDVTGVTLAPTTASLLVASTQQLTPTVAPANATNKNVTYTTSNSAVATVSASGLITAVSAGNATITVTTQDKAKTATCTVTVTSGIAVTGVTLTPSAASLNVGATQQLTATVSPANATVKTVTYSSSNNAVATVSASGLVTAVSAGSANITVTTTNGSKTAVSAITVNQNQCADQQAVVTCFKTASTITIDGNLNESVWCISNSLTKSSIGTKNNTTTYNVLWDANNLYIGVKVLDANLFSSQPEVWNADGVEIFIDGANNGGTAYDANDRQFIVTYNKAGIWANNGNTTGILSAQKAISGGYSVEISIPWTNLGITPADNLTIGFDVANGDDDSGAGRQTQGVWNGNDMNWSNPLAFGDLVLSGSLKSEDIATGIKPLKSSVSGVSIYPNPVNDLLTINLGEAQYQSIAIFSISGSLVLSQEIEGQESININFENLNAGIYMVRLVGEQGAETFKVVKK